jgi:hypothetical protein
MSFTQSEHEPRGLEENDTGVLAAVALLRGVAVHILLGACVDYRPAGNEPFSHHPREFAHVMAATFSCAD